MNNQQSNKEEFIKELEESVQSSHNEDSIKPHEIVHDLMPIVQKEIEREREKLIEEILQKFARLGILGKDEKYEWKGFSLYTRTIKMLSELKTKEGEE